MYLEQIYSLLTARESSMKTLGLLQLSNYPKLKPDLINKFIEELDFDIWPKVLKDFHLDSSLSDKNSNFYHLIILDKMFAEYNIELGLILIDEYNKPKWTINLTHFLLKSNLETDEIKTVDLFKFENDLKINRLVFGESSDTDLLRLLNYFKIEVENFLIDYKKILKNFLEKTF